MRTTGSPRPLRCRYFRTASRANHVPISSSPRPTSQQDAAPDARSNLWSQLATPPSTRACICKPNEPRLPARSSRAAGLARGIYREALNDLQAAFMETHIRHGRYTPLRDTLLSLDLTIQELRYYRREDR